VKGVQVMAGGAGCFRGGGGSRVVRHREEKEQEKAVEK
jgi:hypothetical protein